VISTECDLDALRRAREIVAAGLHRSKLAQDSVNRTLSIAMVEWRAEDSPKLAASFRMTAMTRADMRVGTSADATGLARRILDEAVDGEAIGAAPFLGWHSDLKDLGALLAIRDEETSGVPSADGRVQAHAPTPWSRGFVERSPSGRGDGSTWRTLADDALMARMLPDLPMIVKVMKADFKNRTVPRIAVEAMHGSCVYDRTDPMSRLRLEQMFAGRS
jgi:hypothetical protein